MEKLTIKEIAKQAGVSVSTVSRVINNNGNVNHDAKTRVQEVLKKTNFKPNVSARNLKSNKTNSIGLIISDISDRYYSRMTKCLTDLLAERGYSLIICCSNGSPKRERGFFDFLEEKNVDAIILNTCGENDEDVIKIAEKIPTVLVNRRINETLDSKAIIDYVGSDDISGMFNLTNYLLERGHYNIGLINGSTKLSTARDRFEGFKRAFEAKNPDFDQSSLTFFNGSFSYETGYDGLSSLLSDYSLRPTAIIAANDSIALGAMQYAKDHKIKIPDDISLVTYGDLENASLFFVKPTCMTSDPLIVGRYALNCVFERISNFSKPCSHIIFSTTLCLGNSVVTKPKKH